MIHDPTKQLRTTMTIERRSYFYEKLLKLKDLMNTDTGKRLANQCYQFMLDDLEQFYAE